MSCNEQQEAKIADRNERVKKAYRCVTDVSRRIGESTAACNSASDLFATNIEVLRQKLRENCEKLIFWDPLNYGKKSLELLWRKVYYETVSAAKKHREMNNDFDGYLFTHIMSGIGHFHYLITRIESEFKVKVNELDYMPLDIDEEKEGTFNEEEVLFAKSALFSCLIYLGDLSRYQSEIFSMFDPTIGARYYIQASQIDLSSGMPFNQLGNLFLDKNYNLDSVCCYIHCLSSVAPFEGAIGNLAKIFEKNNQFLETINDNEIYTQTEHIQNTISSFLYFTEILYLGKEVDVTDLCKNMTQKFKIAMVFNINPLPDINKNYSEYSQAIEDEQINPSYLNSNIIHNIVKICLFTNAKMIETDEHKAFGSKAFTLEFLSQLLQKQQKQLEALGMRSPAYKYTPKAQLKEAVEEKISDEDAKLADITSVNGNNDTNNETSIKDDDTDEEESKTNGDVKPKKVLAKRRRRRRAMSSESSNGSDSDTSSSDAETDKSVSNGEELSHDDLSDSTYNDDTDNDSKSSICDDSDTENTPTNGSTENNLSSDAKEEIVIKTDSSTHSIANNNKPKISNNNNKKALDVDGIQNFLMGDNYLPSLKLLQDWILTDKDLLRSCEKSGESLFQCVVDMLNIFLYYFKGYDKFPTEDCKVLDYAKSAVKRLKLEYKTIPLPEDINLRGTNICKFDKDAAEWQLLMKYKPSIYEENIIRILNFIDFGYQIAKIVPRIRFNRSMKIFYLRKLLSSKNGTKGNHKRNREWHNSNNQTENGECVMKRLGRLWLTSTVNELELTGHAAYPSVLALDTAALCKHLKRINQLIDARNFIFLVPTIVLQELDELKRERSSARDAIRWLEMQLQSGSNSVRTQRPGQSRPLPLLKCPRKAPQHVHNFVQILEYCNYFIEDAKRNISAGGDTDTSIHKSSLLILLVGTEPGTAEYKEFSLTGAAQSAGISIEYIGDFYSKWRQNTHKSGKKR